MVFTSHVERRKSFEGGTCSTQRGQTFVAQQVVAWASLLSVVRQHVCVVLAVSKGRASNSCLNRFCQRIAAEVLACGLQLRVRWIPSEWNTSDQGSRVWEFLRGKPFKGLVHVAPHAIRAASSAHAARRARAAEEKACCRGSSVDTVGAGGGASRPAVSQIWWRPFCHSRCQKMDL